MIFASTGPRVLTLRPLTLGWELTVHLELVLEYFGVLELIKHQVPAFDKSEGNSNAHGHVYGHMAIYMAIYGHI